MDIRPLARFNRLKNIKRMRIREEYGLVDEAPVGKWNRPTVGDADFKDAQSEEVEDGTDSE